MKRRKAKSMEALRQRYGYTFVAHWGLGLILFFIIPLISSIWYAFCNMNIGAEGVVTEFVGLTHFRENLTEDPIYLDNLRDSLGTLLYSLPIILALSLILAVILNQRFFGMVAARAVFFLPVIIASSVVMIHLAGPYVSMPLFAVDTSTIEGSQTSMIDFDTLLAGLNLPEQINKVLSDLLGNVFNLIWSCGVQTILFLAGLQSIPLSFYEVSRIEGANKWEEFWFITVPMLRHVITLVTIYTMIELFTAVDNPVIQQAYSMMQDKQVYDRSSAMLWLYFVIVLIVMAVVMGLYKRLCIKRWE